MAVVPFARALLSVALLLWGALPSQGQTLFDMKVYLGPGNELEVVARYHDPADIDSRLAGSRIIPMRLTVTNRSRAPVRLDYGDVRLDLGSDTGLVRLAPVSPAAARAALLADGKYNDFIRFVGAQTDRFTNIDPFERVLPGGTIAPGRKKEGYVFFERRALVPYTSFLALGTTAYPPKILPTNDFQVMSPASESAGLWTETFRQFETWAFNKTAALKQAIREILQGPPPFRTSYALLMGASDYKYMDPLPRVKDDLTKMAAVLQRLGFTVIRVENGKLTAANVRSPQDYFEKVTITSDDRLLVFFAGHGYPRREGDVVRGYLALSDARPGEGKSPNTIQMEEFVAWTQRVPAKHLLVLLESCFSGLAVGGRDVQMMGPGAAAPPPAAAPDPVTLHQLSRDPGRYLLMAGDENQRVPMGNAWGGGLFAHAVVQGLEGRADGDRDGFVTARELYPWVRSYVSAEALKVLGASVTPLIKDLHPVLSKGEFVFTKTK
jgi:Caspase domain